MIQRTITLVTSISTSVILAGCGEWSRVSGRHEHNAPKYGETPIPTSMQDAPNTAGQTTTPPTATRTTGDVAIPLPPPPAPTPTTKDIAPSGDNLINYDVSTNPSWSLRCAVKLSEIAGAQPIESDFKIGYDFSCSPGNANWLRIGVQQPGQPAQYFEFGKSGILSVTGRGPYSVVDDDANKTSKVSVTTGCRLTITSVDITPINQLASP